MNKICKYIKISPVDYRKNSSLMVAQSTITKQNNIKFSEKLMETQDSLRNQTRSVYLMDKNQQKIEFQYLKEHKTTKGVFNYRNLKKECERLK